MISDHMKHDTVTVYAFLSAVLKYLNSVILGLQKVSYFSDGAAYQCKNFKNFANLYIMAMTLNLWLNGISSEQVTERIHVMELVGL